MLHTSRLLLRQWRPADRAPFAVMNADPVVMRHFPAPLARAQSDHLADYIEAAIADRGWGLWAVEVPGVAPFIGFVGLSVPRFEAHFQPSVEIGWRLAAPHQGRGYATEAATAVVRHAFDSVGLDALVSFTVPGNTASRRVMEKIGMTRDPAEDFDHPGLPADSPLRRHVLYRLRAPGT